MEEGEEHKYEVCVQSNMTSRPYLGDALRCSAPGDLVHVDLAQIRERIQVAHGHGGRLQPLCAGLLPEEEVHRTEGVHALLHGHPHAQGSEDRWRAEPIAGTWKAFCEEHQIHHEKSLPRHQAQNGLVEPPAHARLDLKCVYLINLSVRTPAHACVDLGFVYIINGSVRTPAYALS